MLAAQAGANDDGVYNMPDSVDTHKIYDPRAESKMEDVATHEHMETLRIDFPRPYYVFTEDRSHSIRRHDALPKHWLKGAAHLETFLGAAQPGEFYTFQLGVFASDQDLTNVSVTFENLKASCRQGAQNKAGEGISAPIPASAFRCFNSGGNDFAGTPFTKTINVKTGRVQPLWIGIETPRDAAGDYQGQITVTADGLPDTLVNLSLTIAGDILDNSGDTESWRLARMRWLDSKRGLDDDIVASPFTPIQRDGHSLSILGRRIELGENGLPKQIISTFNTGNTRTDGQAVSILAHPMRFVVDTSDGPLTLVPGTLTVVREQDSAVEWQAISSADDISIAVNGLLEPDGSVQFTCRLNGRTTVSDIRLETVYTPEAATYFMGLNMRGGFRPDSHDWSWDQTKNQDGWWIGAVNAGMKLQLKDDNYRTPLVNAYYHFRELNLPKSWDNAGKGGIRLRTNTDDSVALTAFCNSRDLKSDKDLEFNFDLLITPFKPLATENHWAHRYMHPNQGVDDPNLRDISKIKAMGANVVNIHHNKEANPTINYPFYDESFPILKKCVRDAHANNTKVKIYYTTREITNNMPELFAFHSLNGEVICPGAGCDAKPITNRNGPHPWLKEHLREEFIPAWREVVQGRYNGLLDLAVITTPDSRLDNFFMEGLAYTIENTDIDGIYIDDTALGRKSFQRIRRIFDEMKPDAQIDMHSWSHFNGMAGFTPSAYCFMQNLPYYDKIWFGEGFAADYNKVPEDLWLTEISGIPFGVMGEMMYRGMPIRGMLYGMTSRLGWAGDPQPMWRVMDMFGMAGSELLGYWSDICPITATTDDVKVTVYRKPDSAMVVVAGWNTKETTTTLSIDWAALGLDPETTVLYAPEIKGDQEEVTFQPTDTLPMVPEKGWVFILNQNMNITG